MAIFFKSPFSLNTNLREYSAMKKDNEWEKGQKGNKKKTTKTKKYQS